MRWESMRDLESLHQDLRKAEKKYERERERYIRSRKGLIALTPDAAEARCEDAEAEIERIQKMIAAEVAKREG